jgi:hypothetical protein
MGLRGLDKGYLIACAWISMIVSVIIVNILLRIPIAIISGILLGVRGTWREILEAINDR